MQDITIGGKRFKLRPLGNTLSFIYPQSRPLAQTVSKQDVFTWNCATSKQRWQKRGAADGTVGAPVLAVFFEQSTTNFDEDPVATAKMKAKVLGFLGITSMAQLLRPIGRFYGTHTFKLDYSKFDWLKPLASFACRLQITYKWFEAETADEKHRFYIGIPHEAQLTVDIAGFCNLERFTTAVELPANKLKVTDIVLEQDSERSRDARREHLKAERRSIPMGGFGESIWRKRREEIDEELDHLKPSEQEGD